MELYSLKNATVTKHLMNRWSSLSSYRNHHIISSHIIFRILFSILQYAPEPPYDEQEILNIFPQIIQQLANLATCTSPTQTNYSSYFRLLHQLSEVKIGVVLVEMTKTLESNQDSTNASSSNNTNTARNSNTNTHSGPSSEDALEVLRELVEVLLHCVHIDHSQEITKYAADAISACVEEFDGGVPIPILDEILKCIGAGSVMSVTNPEFIKVSAAVASSKRKKDKGSPKGKASAIKLPNRYIAQTNPSYMVAKKVVGNTLDRISTPIANLLNGLLDGDTHVIKDSDIACDPPVERNASKGNIVDAMDRDEEENHSHREEGSDYADVWTIVYELHKVAPGILTTVIGTVANSLQHSDLNKRLRVTRLLGRLFYSKTSDIAVNFHPCYMEWVRRSRDKDDKVRGVMVRHLLGILRNKASAMNLCQEATTALVFMMMHDPQLDIRLKAIAGICELVFDDESHSSSTSSAPFISSDLLKAVGDRVSSKIKKERLDSITGLVKIYNRHYIMPKLKEIERGGEDCEIDVIIEVIQNSCDTSIYDVNAENKTHDHKKGSRTHSLSPTRMRSDHDSESIDERYKFIPKLLFASASISDASDPFLRNRILTLMDDVLMGTESNVRGSDGKKKIKKSLSATSRAVGLTMIINYLQATSKIDKESGKKIAVDQWLLSVLDERQRLQVALRSYIDAKAKADGLPKESEERMKADSVAFQRLEYIAKLTSPPSTGSSSNSSDDLNTVLQKVHTAKDRHIFRCESYLIFTIVLIKYLLPLTSSSLS